jgi:peptide/nickel transport system permease protein
VALSPRLRVIRRRLLQAVPVLVLATFVVFGLLKLMPGDIAITLAGENATEERIAEIRTLYGLDRPFLVQYGSWLANAVQGDLSKSLATGEPVATSIARAFPNTLLIVVLAMSVALAIGIPLGMLAASRPDSARDRIVTSIASLGIAVPNFWLAMLLVAWLALGMGWFPATGAVPLKDDPWKALHHAILPALALAAGGVAEVSRQLRSSLVEILSSPPVRTLRAKGLGAGGHPVEARTEERRRQPADGDHPALQPPAGGHGGGRGRVRHSRHGQPDRQCRADPRPAGGAGRGLRDGAGGDRDQPQRRPALHRARPADQVMLSPFFTWLRRDLRAAISLAFLLALGLLALCAPLIAPYPVTAQDVDNTLAGPSAAHLLGTDDLGRDVFSRMVHGGAATLYASGLAVGIGLLLGLPVGLLAGYSGGWIDDGISRFIDALLSFPSIVLAIAVTGALGIGLTNGMIAVGIVFSPQIARLVRARALVVRQELYVDAARCFGASTARILWRHVLPNTVQPVIVQVTLLLAAALLAEASLSFLGLGIQPPQPSWGSMLARAYQNMELAPEQMYPPGLAILLTALAFNTLGESLRVALDPTTKR